MPAQLHLAADGTEAWFTNGAERVLVPSVKAAETDGVTHWSLRFPAFNSSLDLRQSGAQIEGTLTLVKRGYQQEMPLAGAPDPGYRFAVSEAPTVNLTGRWQATFTEDGGAAYPAVGEFDQRDALLSGTFLTSKGDHRYLAGEVDGSTLRLSTFDGAHAFLFEAQLGPDGKLVGDFWSGTRWHESWEAVLDFDASLPDAYTLTWLKPGYEKLEFRFPDLDGRPVSLTDPKYQGKVVLVTLSGTWCPNCADESAFLADYYRQNRDRGLEIITLLYEHLDEFSAAAAQGRLMVAEHGIEYDVLVAGVSDKTLAAETLPMLNQVLAYPTLIFVDRNGAVRDIHTGFSGPGTGEHYAQFKRDFTARMDTLLAEPLSAGTD